MINHLLFWESMGYIVYFRTNPCHGTAQKLRCLFMIFMYQIHPNGKRWMNRFWEPVHHDNGDLTVWIRELCRSDPCGYPACIRFVFGDLAAGIRQTFRTGEDRLQAERRAAEHAQVLDVSENHHPNNPVALLGYVWIIFPFRSLTIVVGELVYICK